MQHKIKTIHFIGIGGVGMAGLAEVLNELGYKVSGSDIHEKPINTRLRNRQINVSIGHSASNVNDVDCVVYSGAVPADNIERLRALERGIPVIPRAQMLGELLRFKKGIAITGTHGKTTVSSMVASILVTAKLSPTCIIGGRFGLSNDNSITGSGDYVVVEADESDASFLYLQPIIAVITNIDNDHLEAFEGSMDVLSNVFKQFLTNLPFYGVAILCADDGGSNKIYNDINTMRCVRYGFSDDADIKAENIQLDDELMIFDLVTKNSNQPMAVRALGTHNVQNALAACAVAMELGIDIDTIKQGLENFSGVERRLQSYGNVILDNKTYLLIDDYAHHPTEITATIKALRNKYPTTRLVLVFQPHRYSRTIQLMPALTNSLSAADVLILTPVYAAGEATPDTNILEQLCSEIPSHVEKHLCNNLDDVPNLIKSIGLDNDLIITMGAGSIGTLPEKILEMAKNE